MQCGQHDKKQKNKGMNIFLQEHGNQGKRIRTQESIENYLEGGLVTEAEWIILRNGIIYQSSSLFGSSLTLVLRRTTAASQSNQRIC